MLPRPGFQSQPLSELSTCYGPRTSKSKLVQNKGPEQGARDLGSSSGLSNHLPVVPPPPFFFLSLPLTFIFWLH